MKNKRLSQSTLSRGIMWRYPGGMPSWSPTSSSSSMSLSLASTSLFPLLIVSTTWSLFSGELPGCGHHTAFSQDHHLTPLGNTKLDRVISSLSPSTLKFLDTESPCTPATRPTTWPMAWRHFALSSSSPTCTRPATPRPPSGGSTWWTTPHPKHSVTLWMTWTSTTWCLPLTVTEHRSLETSRSLPLPVWWLSWLGWTPSPCSTRQSWALTLPLLAWWSCSPLLRWLPHLVLQGRRGEHHLHLAERRQHWLHTSPVWHGAGRVPSLTGLGWHRLPG